MPPGHDIVCDVECMLDYAANDLSPRGLRREVRFCQILNPDGTTEPAPATHTGWTFYGELLESRWPHDDGSDELPRPVLVMDMGRHNRSARRAQRRRKQRRKKE